MVVEQIAHLIMAFHNIRLFNDSIPLISVSATPYDIIDAKNKGYELDVINGVRSKLFWNY